MKPRALPRLPLAVWARLLDILQVHASTSPVDSTGTGRGTKLLESSRQFETVLSVGLSRARYEIFEYRLYMDFPTECCMLRIRRSPRARRGYPDLSISGYYYGSKIRLKGKLDLR